MRHWHRTLPGATHVARTSGVALPFVLKRLSNTPARLQVLKRLSNTPAKTPAREA